VRRVRFPDIEFGQLFDPANTLQLAEVYVGALGEPGEEQYQVTVCTPAALADLLAKQPFVIGRHWLFVAEFSAPAVEATLRKLIGNVEAPSRAELAEKVGRFGLWEFEGYRMSGSD
jgi:hypothetical protein